VFFHAEDGIRAKLVTGVQTCALPIFAGLVGAYLVGKRIGYGKESLTPHSLTLTMVGAALLWVGWFGFNAGSNLEATGTAALAFEIGRASCRERVRSPAGGGTVETEQC